MYNQDQLLQKIEEITHLDDTSREYELQLTNLARSSDFSATVATDYLQSLFESGQIDAKLKVAYSLFYCIDIYHRNQCNNEIIHVLWDNYSHRFSQFDSLTHLRVLYFLQNIDSSIDTEEQLNLLQEAYKNAVKHTNNAGYTHAFAILFASIYEKNESDKEFSSDLAKKWYSKALTMINSAISGDSSYAKYYCTKGRILSIKGEFSNADAQILLAISKENSARTDYAIRIGSYQYYRLQNQFKQQTTNIQNQMNEEQNTIDKLKSTVSSNIEIIALFSGVISFVLGSLNIASDQSALHAGLLILTLMSCLMAILIVFSILLHLSDSAYKRKFAICILIVSLLCTIVSIVLLGVI